MSSEKTLIRCRDKLIENNLLEYQKGTKSKPNRYKISTVNFTAKNKSTVKNTADMIVDMTVDMGVDMGVDVSNINRLRQRQDIYINLLNIYKGKLKNVKFNEKIKIMSELQKETEYNNLDIESQKELFLELMSADVR